MTKAFDKIMVGLDIIAGRGQPATTDQGGVAAMGLKKVTMNLTEWDIANAELLTARLHSRNKASTVSTALAITEGITRKIEDGEN